METSSDIQLLLMFHFIANIECQFEVPEESTAESAAILQ